MHTYLKKKKFCYLAQKEMSVTKQDIFPPVREIEQQALQGVLGNQTKLIVHVHGKSEGHTAAMKRRELNKPNLSNTKALKGVKRSRRLTVRAGQ